LKRNETGIAEPNPALRSTVMDAKDVGPEETAAKVPSDDLSAFADGARAADGTTPWAANGAGGDETEVVPEITQAAPPELAWSAHLDGGIEPEHHSWRDGWARAAPILFAAAVVAVVVAVVGWIWIEHDKRQNRSAATPSTAPPTPVAASPAPSMPVLDGVYQVILNAAAATSQGNVATPSLNSSTQVVWFAFRPHCTPAACVIHAVMLDDNNHAVAVRDTETLNYVNGHWVEIPVPMSDITPECPRGTRQLELRPAQPEGKWVGTDTLTVTSDCPYKGNTMEAPITATWVGPVPDGLLGAN
jgi:hypothetical protein